MTSPLDRSFAPLQQALDLRAYRQQLLATNIANADTPGYKAQDLNFAAALRSALGNTQGTLPLKTDAPGQVQATATADPKAAFVQYRAGDNVRLDQNSVDMNREQSAFASNSIRYEADLNFLTDRIKALSTAITG